MRIAQVTPVYPPYRGGMGTVAAEYVRLLTEAGDNITVFSPANTRPIFFYGNGAILPQLLWKLRGFDAIHLHYPFFGSDLLVALAAKMWRIPLFTTFHMRPKASGWLGKLFSAYRFCLERWILGSAQNVLVSSKDYADSVGLSHPRLVEMPFGINTVRFSPGVPHDEKVPVILFVGGLDKAHYFKGVDVLLEAIKKGSDLDFSTFHLVIVGSGGEKKRFEQKVKDLGIEEKVLFTGSVPFELLPDMYRSADIHVLPSIDRSEAWGLVTLEAAATGVPSIVSDLPGVRTVIIPGETGLLVRPGDAEDLAASIQLLVNDAVRRKEMGKRARERATELYDDRRLIQRLRDLYESR